MTQTVPLKFTILGLNELKAADKTMQGWAKPSGALPRATKNTAKFGHVAQNAGYQLQDFIVQVQGGTSVARSLGQQLPQLTVGMGAWGAAIGVAAAAIPALVAGMSDSSEAMVSMADSTDAMGEAMDSLAQTSSVVDFKGWVDNFNELDASARAIASALLDVRIQLAEIDFEAAFDSFTSFASVLQGTGGMMRENMLSSMAANMNLTVGQVEKMARIINENGGSLLGNPEAMRTVTEILGTAGEEGAKYLEQLERLTVLQQSLVQGRDIATRARSAGGGSISVPGQEDNGKGLSQELHDFARSVAENQRDAIEGTRKMREEYTLTQEAALAGSRMLETSLDAVVRGTQDAKTAFKQLAVSIIADIARIAATRAAFSFLGIEPSADGNVIQNGKIEPFAKGGVVSSPTFFPMAGGGAGVMGESGPEAILPLGRTGTGELGVKSAPMNVTINNNAPGVAVQTSQSESGLSVDIVLEGVASAIRRGGNDISNSLEDTFALSRGQSAY